MRVWVSSVMYVRTGSFGGVGRSSPEEGLSLSESLSESLSLSSSLLPLPLSLVLPSSASPVSLSLPASPPSSSSLSSSSSAAACSFFVRTGASSFLVRVFSARPRFFLCRARFSSVSSPFLFFPFSIFRFGVVTTRSSLGLFFSPGVLVALAAGGTSISTVSSTPTFTKNPSSSAPAFPPSATTRGTTALPSPVVRTRCPSTSATRHASSTNPPSEEYDDPVSPPSSSLPRCRRRRTAGGERGAAPSSPVSTPRTYLASK
mmetsp:Transcript_47919/g.93637  ORF Transcript_47919/g.93637 Transcript_47919/m.93637 type:complete len:260 (+) Transcript_47919:169-948(+)